MGTSKPRKIAIIGVSASGKTTFAKQLGEKLNLPVTHIDEHMWQPGWNYVGDEQTAEIIKAVIAKEEWIYEGYVTSAVRTELFERADVILYLDYPGWFSAWRYIKRWLKHRKNPRPELPGSPEKFSFKFLKLVYTKGEVYKLEKLFKEHDWNKKIMRFASPKKAKQFLDNLPALKV